MKVASIVTFASFLVPSIATAGVNNWSTIAYNTAAYQILCEVKNSEFALNPWIELNDNLKYKLLLRHECDLSKLSSYMSQEKLNRIIDTHPEYVTHHTKTYLKFSNLTMDKVSARATLVGSTRKKPGSTPYSSSSPIELGGYTSLKYVGVTELQRNSISDGTFPYMNLPTMVPSQSYSTTDNAGLALQRISDSQITQKFPIQFNITLTKQSWSSSDNCRIRLPNAITFTSRDQKEVLLETDGNCTSIWNNSEAVKGSIKFIEPSGTDLQLSGISGIGWNKSIQPTGKIYLSPGKTKNGEYNINTEVTYP